MTAAMADMALLLLIFFMTATSMAPQKIKDIQLPTANADSVDQNHIYVGIDKDQRIIFNGEVISLQKLEAILAGDENSADKKVVIMADQNLPFGAVSGLLDVAKSLDLLDIVFISQPEG